MKNGWIVVADASRARVLATVDGTLKFSVEHDFNAAIAKDLTHLPLHQLREYLKEVLEYPPMSHSGE